MDAAERPVVEYRFYPEAYPNVYIEAAKDLPEVQKVLWFDRFPVTRYHEEHGEPVVEFSDMRFPQVRRGRPAPFTYRVRFGPGGNVISQGWLSKASESTNNILIIMRLRNNRLVDDSPARKGLTSYLVL